MCLVWEMRPHPRWCLPASSGLACHHHPHPLQPTLSSLGLSSLLPSRLGLPDYSSLQSTMGAIGSSTAAFGGVPTLPGLSGGGMPPRATLSPPPLPPMDPSTPLSSHVSLANFGLGGLGNGFSGFGGLGSLGAPQPPPLGATATASLLHPLTPSASASSSSTQLSRTRLFVVVHKVSSVGVCGGTDGQLPPMLAAPPRLFTRADPTT